MTAPVPYRLTLIAATLSLFGVATVAAPHAVLAKLNCSFAITQRDKAECAERKQRRFRRYRAAADKQGIRLFDPANWGTLGFVGTADASFGYIGYGKYKFCDGTVDPQAREDFFLSKRSEKDRKCREHAAARKEWDSLPDIFTWDRSAGKQQDRHTDEIRSVLRRHMREARLKYRLSKAVNGRFIVRLDSRKDYMELRGILEYAFRSDPRIRWQSSSLTEDLPVNAAGGEVVVELQFTGSPTRISPRVTARFE